MANKLLLLLAVQFVLTNYLFAQKTVSHENQQWLQYYNETKFNKHWSLLADGGFRWKDGFDESFQFLVRAGVGYTVNNSVKISSGLAYFGHYNDNTLYRVEFRPHQDITLKTNFNNIKLSQRLRIEERFFTLLDDHTNSFNVRFRYSISVNLPLFQLSKNNPDTMFLLVVGDEIFINAGKDIVYNVFDRNRLIISPTFQLNKNLSISPTWNNQYAATTSQGLYKHTQVFWLQVRHNIDLSDN